MWLVSWSKAQPLVWMYTLYLYKQTKEPGARCCLRSHASSHASRPPPLAASPRARFCGHGGRSSAMPHVCRVFRCRHMPPARRTSSQRCCPHGECTTARPCLPLEALSVQGSRRPRRLLMTCSALRAARKPGLIRCGRPPLVRRPPRPAI